MQQNRTWRAHTHRWSESTKVGKHVNEIEQASEFPETDKQFRTLLHHPHTVIGQMFANVAFQTDGIANLQS